MIPHPHEHVSGMELVFEYCRAMEMLNRCLYVARSDRRGGVKPCFASIYIVGEKLSVVRKDKVRLETRYNIVPCIVLK
jgi:hypothetical protein